MRMVRPRNSAPEDLPGIIAARVTYRLPACVNGIRNFPVFFAGVYAPIRYYYFQFTLRCRLHTSSRGDVFVFFNPLLGVILWPRATTVRRRKSKNPRRTRRKSKPAAFRPALPISLKTSLISQARYNGPFLFLRGNASHKSDEHRQNKFPICAAVSWRTTDLTGGFVGDATSDFGKLLEMVHCRGNLPRTALHAPLLPRFLHLIDHRLGHAFHCHLFSVRQLLADLRNFSAGRGKINPS